MRVIRCKTFRILCRRFKNSIKSSTCSFSSGIGANLPRTTKDVFQSSELRNHYGIDAGFMLLHRTKPAPYHLIRSCVRRKRCSQTSERRKRQLLGGARWSEACRTAFVEVGDRDRTSAAQAYSGHTCLRQSHCENHEASLTS